MKCEVLIVPAAEKELEKIPALSQTVLIRKILALENNPRPRGIKKLSGREEYRLRVSDYRVLYTIDDGKKVVVVFAVGHRRDIYR